MYANELNMGDTSTLQGELKDTQKKEMCVFLPKKATTEIEESIRGLASQGIRDPRHSEGRKMVLSVMCKPVTDREPLSPDEMVSYLKSSAFWSDVLPESTDALEQVVNVPPIKADAHNRLSVAVPAPVAFQEYTDIAGFACYRGKPIMNCSVEINCLINREPVCEYDCTVYINGKELQKDVEVDTFLSGQWLNKIPGFAVMTEDNGAEKMIKRYLNKKVLDQGFNNERHVFRKPGWHIIKNKLQYVTIDGILGRDNVWAKADCGQHFPVVTGPISEIADAFLRMSLLTPRSWVSTIIMIYTVMSSLYSLYKMAGFVPKLILFLFGPSGSRKTSSGLAATQIEQLRDPKFILKSTAAGLEEHFKEYRDAVMLIDDLAPTESKQEEKRMHENLELLVRVFGDGTAKLRNHDYRYSSTDPDQYEAAGGLIITGEYIASEGSSLARLLLLPLEKDAVDNRVLTELQEKPIVGEFLKGFIQYIASHASRVVEYIGQRVKEYRKQFSREYSHARYAEYRAQLTVAAEILIVYLINELRIDHDTSQSLGYRFNYCIECAMDYNSQKTTESNPAVIFCVALSERIEDGTYFVIPVGKRIDENQKLIFEDKDNYYVRPKDISAIFNSYRKEHGITGCQYKPATLINMLCDKDIAIKGLEGNTVRYSKKIPGTGNIRFVQLDKEKLISHARFHEPI